MCVLRESPGFSYGECQSLLALPRAAFARQESMMEDVIRCTVLDADGTVSFIAHWAAASALTAACSHDPTTLNELLNASTQYDRGLREMVTRGLAAFDQHNGADDLSDIHQQLKTLPPRRTPVFRVLDTVTREASLRPVRAGVVLFNLPAKRIVQ